MLCVSHCEGQWVAHDAHGAALFKGLAEFAKTTSKNWRPGRLLQPFVYGMGY